MRQWRQLALLTAAAAIGSVAMMAQGVATTPQGIRARADIKGDKISGTVELREIDVAKGTIDPKFTTGSRAVELSINVTGLAPGVHGMHLHAVGRCEAPGFTSAGGHFDPGPAGNADPDANHPFHMGDLANLVADASGRAVLTTRTTRVTLSEGLMSLLDADGTAIIIHGNPDQGTTGAPKSGVSGGPRIACGVITKQ